ncbi:MAG TPA: hypothetical protein VKE40_17980 [Gemmataceae bacterium]|nr:hypothetical protein [Gemmataceae bacterium]
MARVIPRDCPECGGTDLRVTITESGNRWGPRLLPGLGTWLAYGPLTVVVCRECGFVRFFAQPATLEKLDKAKDWERVKSTLNYQSAEPDVAPDARAIESPQG